MIAALGVGLGLPLLAWATSGQTWTPAVLLIPLISIPTLLLGYHAKHRLGASPEWWALVTFALIIGWIEVVLGVVIIALAVLMAVLFQPGDTL